MEIFEPSNARVSDAPAMTPRQRLVVTLLLGTNVMLSADFSILNIALPEVGQAVGLNVSQFPFWPAFISPLRRMSPSR
jgi:hypothetical protein